MALTRSYERRSAPSDDTTRVPSRPSAVARPASRSSPPPSSKAPATPATSSGSSAMPSAPTNAPPPPGRFTRLSAEEMARHYLDGLCFNCPEKFSRDHAKQCTMRGIYFLEAPNDDTADDTAGENLEDDMTISMHTLSGVRTVSTLSLITTISSGQFSALVDSGSTHCFISEHTARRLDLAPIARPGLTVGVANGDRVPLTGVCKNVPITIIGEAFYIDLHVIDLHGYELVLGCDWLRTLGPILWDFQRQTMAFWRDDHRVQWRGSTTSAAPRLAATAVHDMLNLLLAEFAELFTEPMGLPPARPFNHHIHLQPGTPPVAVRPYRYPQLLKDEVETQ
jgi:hypothetical protein